MGAGTPGCLETGEVGNAPSSKQPGWNKTPKAKNREAGYGNKIKSIAFPPHPRAERGTPMLPTGTPTGGWGGWCGGVSLHPSVCVPFKVCVPTHGPVCWSQSRNTDWAQLPTCSGGGAWCGT